MESIGTVRVRAVVPERKMRASSHVPSMSAAWDSGHNNAAKTTDRGSIVTI